MKSSNVPPARIETRSMQAEADHARRWQCVMDGKLIFDSGFGIPDETPVNNVRVMFAAARRYGT